MTPTCKLCDGSGWLIPERLEGGPYRCLCGREQTEEIERLKAERDRETELRRAAEKHNAELKDYLDQVGYPNEWDDLQAEVTRLRAELEQAQGDRTAIVRHIKAFLGDDWGMPTEPQHQQSFLVAAIHHLAGSRDSFRAAWEHAEAEVSRLRAELEQAQAERDEAVRSCEAWERDYREAQNHIAVLEPPAQNYNRTLARAEQAERALEQARREAFQFGFLATVNRETGAWQFDGPSAADREPQAWDVFRRLSAEERQEIRRLREESSQ